MTINVLTIIILITVVVSIGAFNNRAIMDRFMFNPYDVKHYKNHIRIVAHMLIHADYMHLGFNMMALYFLGNIFLDVPCNVYQDVDCGLIQTFGNGIGQMHFVTLYILGGLFATVIPYLRHQDNPSYRSLGASGAVSAVIFGAILWNPSMPLNLLFIPIAIPAYIFGPLYLLFEFLMDKRGGTGIAHDAHIGGALFGIIYVLIINIDKGTEFVGKIFNF
jgi:membrane associated rhomboid family serine protease